MKHLRGFKELFESVQELSQEQRDWLDECTKGFGTWEVNSRTGLVDVRGSFNCRQMNLTDFKGVRFGQVSRGFDCDKNSLTSLEGAPQSVGGYFTCFNNELKSLEGAPQSVGGDLDCSDNELTSLEGAPQSVGGAFYCSSNKLKSLEGLPDGFRVDGNFDCSYNELKSLEGAPQSVGWSFVCSNNELTSLEGAPQSVGYDFHCSDNPISERAIKEVLKRMSDKKITLEQAVSDSWEKIPEVDHIYLAKHHPSLSDEDKRGYEAMGRLKRRVI